METSSAHGISTITSNVSPAVVVQVTVPPAETKPLAMVQGESSTTICIGASTNR